MAVDRIDGKYPDEKLDYGIDWTLRLNDGETIVSSTWDNTTEFQLSNETMVGGQTTVRVTGGTAGQIIFLRNQVTTSDGRILEEDLRIEVFR